MGYEILYKFKEKTEDGFSEEIKEKKARVGKDYEDIPLEVVAGKIMAQLARRNILVTDVEIYEYTKKKLSYKEADDGILIKNKKFRFDDGPAVVGEQVEDENVQAKLVELLAANPEILQQITKKQPHQINRPVKKVLRYEVFDPNPVSLAKTKSQGLHLKPGKKYGIIEEKQVGAKDFAFTRYVVKDDSGHEVEVDAECFVVPVQGKLLHEDKMLDNGPAPGIDLWSSTNAVMDDVPDIRGN
jgi:hypothetical protein